MPKKDPITGCMVMTMPEFLNAEAEREGKGRCGGEILADIFTELDNDSKRIEDELRKPENALEAIKQALKEAEEYWEDEYGEGAKVPEIVEVVHVIEVQVGQSMRSSGQVLKAEVKTADGRLCYVSHHYSHWSGTMMDPPEEDSTLYFGEFRPRSEHPWKCVQCGNERPTGERHWESFQQIDNKKNEIHTCPRCNGWEREQHKKRRAAMKKARK